MCETAQKYRRCVWRKKRVFYTRAKGGETMSFLLEGILAVTWQQLVMYVVGIVLIWLAVKKEYEPSLLLPLGFGAILVNLPYSGVIDQMVQGKVPAAGIIQWLFETGIEASEAMPILLFIGIGAMIDFGPLSVSLCCFCSVRPHSLVSLLQS